MQYAFHLCSFKFRIIIDSIMVELKKRNQTDSDVFEWLITGCFNGCTKCNSMHPRFHPTQELETSFCRQQQCSVRASLIRFSVRGNFCSPCAMLREMIWHRQGESFPEKAMGESECEPPLMIFIMGTGNVRVCSSYISI